MIRLARAALTTAFTGFLAASLLSTSGCDRSDDTDTISPYIRFTFPPENVTVLDDIATIRVEAQDNVGIKQVVFMAEGDTLASPAAEPYQLFWNTTAYPDCTGADSYVLLVATAEDFAGNSRSTHREFYLDNEGNPPIQVELLAPTNVTKHSITLSWERSVDYDFSHYLLRRNTTTVVTGTSDSVALIDERNTTSFTDKDTSVSPFGLLENTDYYYRLWVHDVFDSSSASDSVVTARTLLPQPVVINATSSTTKYKVGLEWQPSPEDVDYYRLHRGLSAAALDSIADIPADNHSYLDTGLTANTSYYYYLYLIDEAGYTHIFRSEDVLEVQTLALPPPVLEDPPHPITKYSATIAWETIEEQEDPSWVALYRGPGPTVDTTDILLYAATRNEANAAVKYVDSGLQQSGTYYYRLHHRDSQANTAWSNTVSLTTLTLAEVWSGGLGYTQGKYQLELAWDPYSYGPEVDFAGYTLSRGGQVIFPSSNAADNQYTDTGLAKNTTYSYRLEVADTSGASVAVTLDATTRDIFPAEIVSLEPTADWAYDIAWLPSQESDSEFDRYELLRSNDTEEIFEDNDGDNTADCLLSGSCVQVDSFDERQPADTLKYQDNDPTLVTTNQIDTTLMLPRPIDTTLIVITPVDTTLIVPTLVDTVLMVDTTEVDTSLWIDIPVDTTLMLPRQVDTTLTLIIPVDTTVIDTTLPIFNYVVLTYDVAGEYIRSNIVGDTLYASPSPVQLTGPDTHLDWVSEKSIRIEWTRAQWPSPGLEAVFFSRYEIWRNSRSGQQPGAAGSSYQRIATIADINETSYSDSKDLGQQQDWFYVVVVRDIFGQGAVSNEVKGWTEL